MPITNVQGFGVQPFGVSAGGLGQPADQPAPGATYAGQSDLVAARLIDPLAHDYVVDRTTLPVAHLPMGPKAQRVFLLLSTRRGGLSFSATTGNDYLNLPSDNGTLRTTAQRTAEVALADMIRANEIALVSVDATRTLGQSIEIVTWRDLATQQINQTTLPGR